MKIKVGVLILAVVVTFGGGLNIADAQTPNATKGVLLKCFDPDCGPKTECHNMHGTVRVRILIGADGKVKGVTVVSGNRLLIEPVVKAVKQWEYIPYTMNGKPIEAITTVDVVLK